MEGGRAFPLPPGWKAGTGMSGRMGRRGATAFDSVTAPLLSSMERTRRSESRGVHWVDRDAAHLAKA